MVASLSPGLVSARNLPVHQAVGQPRISPCSAGRRRHPSRSVTKPLPLWVPRWRFMRTASVNSSCSGFANLRTGRKEVPARRHYGMRTHRSRLLPANWPCRVRHAVSHVMHSLSSKARCPGECPERGPGIMAARSSRRARRPYGIQLQRCSRGLRCMVAGAVHAEQFLRKVFVHRYAGHVRAKRDESN